MHAPAAELTTARPDLAPVVETVREAAAARRRLAPRGAGTWRPDRAGAAPLAGAPASLLRFDPADLVATAGAALPMADLHSALATGGAFVALDAPGDPRRQLGGVLASGSGGPLAASMGAPRDQVLGMTFVAGNGTAVKSGGRVVKNVAGFDLAKILVGSFGGFGYITDAHLRLRALPPADRTAAFGGALPAVAAAAHRMLAARCGPAAFEVVSPALARATGLAGDWAILARTLGTPEATAEELAACAAATDGGWHDVKDGTAAWRAWGPAVGAARVLLRIGADPSRWSDAIRLAERHLGAAELVSVTVPRGTVRVGLGQVEAARLEVLRGDAASLGWPITLERGPASLLAAAGTWGAMPPRALALARALREAFDPDGVFEAPLWAEGRNGGRAE